MPVNLVPLAIIILHKLLFNFRIIVSKMKKKSICLCWMDNRNEYKKTDCLCTVPKLMLRTHGKVRKPPTLDHQWEEFHCTACYQFLRRYVLSRGNREEGESGQTRQENKRIILLEPGHCVANQARGEQGKSQQAYLPEKRVSAQESQQRTLASYSSIWQNLYTQGNVLKNAYVWGKK